jgi:ribosome-binding protein aMBF1 (putative translation factor)
MKTKTCPVCDMEIKDGGIAVNVDGRELTVCCDDCAQKVEENPAEYVEVAK